MEKDKCKIIEDLIPLYIEGDINKETKEFVENHIKACPKCTELVNAFSEDQISLDEFNENLPETKTFKRSMKKLKRIGLITLSIAILIAIGVGFVSYKLGEKPKDDTLTLKMISKTFNKQGLKLKESSKEIDSKYKIEGVKPTVFTIDGKKGVIAIFMFKSFPERESVIRDSSVYKDTAFSYIAGFNAKNAFIVYIPDETNTEAGLNEFGKNKDMISDIVFKYLNDGKEIIYKGESATWQGTVTLRYYEHWWKDENGVTNYENENSMKPRVKYKLSNKEDVGQVDFKCETTGGDIKANTVVNKDGYLEVGYSGSSNGEMPRIEDPMKMSLKWQGKEENITLTAQK